MNKATVRRFLAGHNPVPPDHPVDPPTSERARALVEQIMTTTPSPRPEPASAAPIAPAPSPRARRRVVPLALAGAAAAGTLVVGLALGGISPFGSDPAPDQATGQAMELRLPSGNAASSCVMFDVSILAAMDVAFAGTVTATSERQVEIEVDRWYRGAPTPEPETVRLATPDPSSSAILDGVRFETGQRYLVTATRDGNVNGCGFSGLATPDLEKAFSQAFGS